MSVQAETTDANRDKKQEDFLTAMFANEPPVAPVVGPHRKNSLAGFDPLLTPSSVSTNTASNMNLHHHPLNGTVPPHPFAEMNTPNASPVDNEKQSLDYDLMPPPPPPPPMTPPRKNSETADSTPLTPLSMLPFRKKREKKGHRKTQSLASLSGDVYKSYDCAPKRREKDVASLSPPRAARKQVANNTTQSTGATTAPPPQAAPLRGGMLPWPKRKQGNKGHRKTVSMTALPSGQDWKPPPHSSATASPVVAREQIALMSPMIQDLLKLELEAGADLTPSLFTPSLAKPRPTSFLTGKEQVARSSEQDPTAWQLEIPAYTDVLVAEKLCQFMDTYGTEECLLDLNSLVGINRMDLLRFARVDCELTSAATNTAIAECHRPIVEALLECGNDISEVKGFFTSADNDGSPDSRREVLILERQNKFLCLFRGTAAEQHGKFTKHPDTVQLKDGLNASVYIDRYTAFSELQASIFQLLDKLTEDNPFCDIMFAGHSYGGALATLAAYFYANTRTALRVSCITSASPKIGMDDFRWAVHSTPNLNMWRLEYGTGRHHHVRAAAHVGHVIRISPPSRDSEQPEVLAYKFGGDDEGHHPLLSSLMNKQKDKNANEYVSILEDLDKDNWIKDFHNEDGAGVRGKDNEARNMT